jgi:hypothetical protein
MLIEHRLSHLTKGRIFSSQLHHSDKSHKEKKTDVRDPNYDKGFKMRVFKFTAIVATNSSNSISIPLILQTQDHIPNKTKRLPLVS